MVNFVLNGINTAYTLATQIAAESVTITELAAAAANTAVNDATSGVTVNASALNSVFVFQADGIDVSDLATTDFQYGAQPSNWPAIVLSACTVNKGNELSAGIQSVAHDFVRNLANTLIGVPAADAFNNEVALRGDVTTGDATVRSNIQGLLANAGTSASPLTNATNTDANVTKRLVEQLAGLAPTRFSADTGEMLNDSNKISGGGDFDGYYKFMFKAGDTIQFKVEYNPHADDASGGAGAAIGDGVATKKEYVFTLTLS